MSDTLTVLIIDDDDELLTELSEQLTSHEFKTLVAVKASEGLKLARNTDVDLVLLDVGLPDIDGREACKLMRRGGFQRPIIILTGENTESDTILGLDSGANDYVTKPFKLGVLLARIRAQFRHRDQHRDAVFAIGPYTFKPASRLVVDRSGSEISLTERESLILRHLYLAGERVVARELLLHELWGHDTRATVRAIDTHICRLRRKIEGNPAEFKLLITEPGGYKLVPQI